MDRVFVFVENSEGPEGYSAVFEATDGDLESTPAGGYFYLLDSTHSAFIRSLQIYQHSTFELKESDVQVFWSADGKKCGVAIWGRMRGVIDITNGQLAAPLHNPASPALIAADWLQGFESYLDREQFIIARQRFWKQRARELDSDLRSRPDEESPIETNFVVYAKGPGSLFGVFEDDCETGYLYVLDAENGRILRRVQIYDRASDLGVDPKDVQVRWSENDSKCGVLIWDRMRGIIDLPGNREGRVKMENPETPGIGDREWLNGF